MVPKMPDSYLTAGCFCLYSPDREERNGYGRKQMQGSVKLDMKEYERNDGGK